jgi:hypothetical protein
MLHFRTTLAILHFNENVDRAAKMKDGHMRYNVVFPKYRNGAFIVKKVKEPPTYGKFSYALM